MSCAGVTQFHGEEMEVPAWVLVHLIPGRETSDGLCRSGLLKSISSNMKASGVDLNNTQHAFRYNGPGKCSAAGRKDVGMDEWERQSESFCHHPSFL